MSKAICCPECGPRIKLFNVSNDLLIKGAIEIKCRKCKSIVGYYGGGKTVIISKNR